MITFRRSDRVIIRAVEAINDHIYVGNEGRYLSAAGTSGKSVYLVEVAAYGGSRTVRATSIERASSTTGRFQVAHPPLTQQGRASVGDRVRILEVLSSDSASNRLKVGQVGTVEETVAANAIRPKFYRVRVGAALVRATKVERVAWSFSTTNANEPKPAEEAKPETAEILIDGKRLQAAHAAHALVGQDAPLDTLIGLAEFVLGEHTKVMRVDLGALAAGSPEPAPAPAEMSLDEARKVTANRFTVDNLEITFDAHPDDDVVQVEGSGEAVYLRAHEVDRLITFLRAAKVAHAAR